MTTTFHTQKKDFRAAKAERSFFSSNFINKLDLNFHNSHTEHVFAILIYDC